MPRRNAGPQVKYRGDRDCWEVVEFVAGRRKRLATGLGSSAQAQEALAEILLDRQRPRGKCHPSQRLIGDVLADYAIEHGPTTAAPELIAYHIDALTPFWGEKTVAEITRANGMSYAEHRRRAFEQKQRARNAKSGKKTKIRALSDSTIARELTTLAAALKHDHSENRLDSFPAVWRPEPGNSRERWLTRAELAALIRAARTQAQAKNHLPKFILLAYYSGQRKQAVLQLRWPQVDLERGIIDWNPPGRRATNKRRPRQPVNRRLLRLLKYWCRRGTDLGPVLHRNQQALGDIKNGFETAARDAGLKDVTPHTLRHTAITHMLQRGVPIWEVAGYFGVTAKTIENTYGHHAADYMGKARDAL